MTYASTSIDRRAQYYARSAPLIAADPLDFYTRAENGRKFQINQLNARTLQPQALPSAPDSPIDELALRRRIRAA